MHLTSAFLLLFATGLLTAADLKLTPPNLRDLPPKQFDQLLHKGLESRQIARPLSAATVCSIPLVELHAGDPKQYASRDLPAQRTYDSMSRPAPPVCKQR